MGSRGQSISQTARATIGKTRGKQFKEKNACRKKKHACEDRWSNSQKESMVQILKRRLGVGCARGSEMFV
eukprot:758184-Hanusia_phi.AAC.1